jgi:hypothetical protein
MRDGLPGNGLTKLTRGERGGHIPRVGMANILYIRQLGRWSHPKSWFVGRT